MPTLAPKLPWTHAFAGGYPRVAGQALPTDPDAIDYLERVKAADGGAAVEVGVAMAVDAFIKGCKADSAGYAGDPTRTVWDAMKASCIMCGARTIAGALVPLKLDQGSELWDMLNIPEPTITQSGSHPGQGVWDAANNTIKVLGYAGNIQLPKFDFAIDGVVTGAPHRCVGRLSGDIGDLYGGFIRIGNQAIIVNADGTFAKTVYPTNSLLSVAMIGTQGPSNVTIESLSIRVDRSTPTPYNFASGDYSRTTGLAGNGSTKYLDSNYAYPADYQNDCHLAVSISALPTTGLSAGYGDAGANGSFVHNTAARLYQSGAAGTHVPADTTTLGIRGASRQNSASFDYRFAGTTESASIASSAITHEPLAVFGRQRNTGTPDNLTDARLAFYSIGSSLDLAALDNRVSTLVTAIAAAL